MNFQAYTLPKNQEWCCIEIKTDSSQSRTPIHLCCILDTSISMASDNKLENVKQSLKFLLKYLGPNDKLSIITFSSEAKTILNQISLSPQEKENISARISLMSFESLTNLSAGIIQARESLIHNTNLKQGILLLTDGEANVGLIEPNEIIKLMNNTLSHFDGTSISCIGYGLEHNVELLENISSEGGGSYYVVNNLEDVASVFGDILGGLISCSSQQVKVILPKLAEIKSRYTIHNLDNYKEVIIGDMSIGMEAVFLAKIPLGENITLKGFDIKKLDYFEINCKVSNTQNNTLLINGQAHYLRFEVLELLEESRNILKNKLSDNVTNQINKINNCIKIIREHMILEEHYLWDLLLSELETCKNSLENKNNDGDLTQIMTQHMGYLGRMRGFPATSINSLPPINHTFSNNIQRQITLEMTQNLSVNNTLFENNTVTIDTIPVINHTNCEELDDYNLTMLPLPTSIIERQSQSFTLNDYY